MFALFHIKQNYEANLYESTMVGGATSYMIKVICTTFDTLLPVGTPTRSFSLGVR
jgi:hypothetical protein